MEYSDSDKRFMAAYERGMEGLFAESAGFSWNCGTCLDNHGICCEHKGEHLYQNGEIVDEPGFSSHPCEICGSNLGGDRHTAHALIRTALPGHVQGDDYDKTEIVHLEICMDCVLYMSNGDLPEVWE